MNTPAPRPKEPDIDSKPFLVFRDKIGVASEVEFMRRQYIGFRKLRPIWVGREVQPYLSRLQAQVYRLGDEVLRGYLRRLAFRYFGIVPALPFRNLEPVVHAQFARGGALALPIARSQKAALVVTLHGGDVSKAKNWQGTVLAARWPAVLETAARFVCVSEAVAEAALARGVPPRKLTVLPIGAVIDDAPPERDPKHFLFVGRFVEKKGITVLAEAMRRLRAAGDTTRLVCVGDGPLRPMLERLQVEETGIELTGWLRYWDVVERQQSALALIVPSIIAANGDAEGLPSVIPEAFAMGCPVIATAQGGMAEAVRDGSTGLLVPPNDPAALAVAMRRLSADHALADRLGAAGFAYAHESLNAETQSRELEALLMAVVEDQKWALKRPERILFTKRTR